MKLNMLLTFAVLASLFLSGPVLSQNTPCKTVLGATNFNFTEFVSYEYSYVMGPDTPNIQATKSATVTIALIGDKYYFTYAVIKKDGSQVITNYLLESQEGATIKEYAMDNGVPSNISFSITLYHYKPKAYAQFYVCGPTGSTQDIRFAIGYGDTKLTYNLRNELVANDAQFQFNGKLIPIGHISNN